VVRRLQPIALNKKGVFPVFCLDRGFMVKMEAIIFLVQ